MLAKPPGKSVCCAVAAFTMVPMMGSEGLGGWIWNGDGAVITLNPEITLISEEPTAAPDATTTLAMRWVGLSTQTRLTVTSLVPNPTVTCPSANRVFAPVMSTMAVYGTPAIPEGKDEGVTVWICGLGDEGYV